MNAMQKTSIIYIVHCVGTSFYKIGMTSIQMITRLSGLQNGCPFRLSVEFEKEVPCRKALKIEKRMHGIFYRKRVRGEWFDLNKEELEDVIETLEAM